MGENVFSVAKYAAKARQAVAEGIVLLKNDDNILPLPAGSRIALFGRSQFCYYKSGTGSGGLVNTAYVTGIREALEKDRRFELNAELKKIYETWLESHPFDTGNGWASEPWFQEEMPVSRELAEAVKKDSDTAVIIIGRTAGEDKDNLAAEGSYLLTKVEEEMLETCVEQENAVMGTLLKVEMLDEVGIDSALIDTAKGKSTTIQVAVKERGTFRLEFSCRASESTPDLAQLSVSVFQDKQLAGTVTIAGSEKEWQRKTVEFPMPLFHYTFFMKLFFGMSGMELRDVKVVMVQSLEEEIRRRMKEHREQAPE